MFKNLIGSLVLNPIFKIVSKTRIWVWFCKKVLANLTFRVWGYTEFPIEKYFEIVRAIRESEKESPGIYAFCCSDPKSFAGILITGLLDAKFSHAGLINPNTIFDEDHFNIYHMKGKGFVEWNLLQLLKEIDVLSIVKYEFETKEKRDYVVARIEAIKEMSPKYDFQQELESKKVIYCSEYVYLALEDTEYLSKEGSLTEIKSNVDFDRKTFEPDDVEDQATKALWSNV